MTPVVEKPGVRRRRLVRRHHAQLVSTRRHLHAHPELALAEYETTALLERGCARRAARPAPAAGTGLVCDIGSGDRSSCSGPTSTRCRCPT